MKKIKVLLITVFLLTAGTSLQQVAAQDKSKAELEKEAKLQQAIDLEKKAWTEQKKAQSESEELMKVQEDNMKDMMKEFKVQVDKPGETFRYYGQGGNRSFSFDEPFVFSSQGGENYFRHSYGGDSERTTWDFSKSVKENTFTRDYTFDVEKTVNTVVMSVMGDCKSGEIRIKIVTPGGKTYSDILIDESGNLNWRKSFTISETENQDKTGEWKYQISSNKATGFFKISLQTY